MDVNRFDSDSEVHQEVDDVMEVEEKRKESVLLKGMSR